MAAVMERVADKIAPEADKKSRGLPARLEPYKFKPGHAMLPGAGRPKGSRDAATLYLESLPIKARQWVKSTAPAVLVDARKIALPIESDAASSATVQPMLVAFFERHLLRRFDAAEETASRMPQAAPALPRDAQAGLQPTLTE